MWLETLAFGKITEPETKLMKKGGVKFADLFTKPFKNREFMKLMSMLGFFYFAWYMSMSYSSVYQLRYLKIPYTFITAMGIINPVLQMVWYPMWGKLVDKYTPRFIIRIALWLYSLHALLWFFMTPSTYYFMMPILQINASILGPAFMLGVFNSKYNIIPQEGRSLYDGFYTAAVGTIILVAPTVGNLVKTWIENNMQAAGGLEFPQFRLLFAIASVLVFALNIYNLISAKKRNNLEQEKEFISNLFKRGRKVRQK
jgi:MFS family permease